MITLLLTLFISMFSYCPSINRLEDHNENTITINENVPLKKSITYNDYLYLGLEELVSYDNYVSFSNNLKQYDYFPYTNITVENFFLGSTCRIDIYNQGYDISIGSFVDGDFNAWGSSTGLLYITFSYDGSLDYSKNFEVDFVFSNYTLKVIGYYYYLDTVIDYPICNIEVYENNDLVSTGWRNTAFKFYYPQLSQLLAGYLNTVNNYDLGYKNGLGYGYQTGYSAGYQEGVNLDSTAATIFNGVLEIGLLPVNFFLSIFNFEVFGINIKGIVSGLLTVSVVIIIIRFLFGGKDNDK